MGIQILLSHLRIDRQNDLHFAKLIHTTLTLEPRIAGYVSRITIDYRLFQSIDERVLTTLLEIVNLIPNLSVIECSFSFLVRLPLFLRKKVAIILDQNAPYSHNLYTMSFMHPMG